MGADSPKCALETQERVPKAEHIDPIKSCLFRDNLHVTADLCSMGHLLTPALKAIRRQEHSFSSRGLQRTCLKTSSSQTRKFSPLRSSITTSTTGFMLKRPMRCILRVQEAITLPTSWFGGWCPSGAGNSSFLRERCENWCPSISRGCATRSCKTS